MSMGTAAGSSGNGSFRGQIPHTELDLLEAENEERREDWVVVESSRYAFSIAVAV